MGTRTAIASGEDPVRGRPVDVGPEMESRPHRQHQRVVYGAERLSMRMCTGTVATDGPNKLVASRSAAADTAAMVAGAGEGTRGPVRIRLCSSLAIEAGGRTLTGRELGSRKARTLLARLAADRGRLLPVDVLAEALWPTDPPVDPAANVATLVSRTRRLLGADVLEARGRSYGLRAGAFRVDLDEAADLIAEAEDRHAAGETALAASAGKKATEVLGSQAALADEGDADWVRAVRVEADELRRRARHVLAAAVTLLDPAAAVRVAVEAVTADPYDERATRDLMRALVADGKTAAALTTYRDLARRLREELGTDPDSTTSRLHASLLREAPLPTEAAARRARRDQPALVGRGDELALVSRYWADAGAGHGALVLIEGEAGIGKTRLLDAAADVADRTGGLVLRARCHPAERSLFLQPFVDAVRPTLLGRPATAVAELVRDHESAWMSLLPDLAELVGVGPQPVMSTPELARRRAYDSVAAVLRRLAVQHPVLFVVDDVQEGAAATVDLLGYLAERLSATRVLLLVAVRAEDVDTVRGFSDRASPIVLGPLPPSAVTELASAAGLAAHGEAVLARTNGHALSVVESLRAIAAGEVGVPESLSAAVLARVARLDEPVRQAVEGASILTGRLDARLLGDLLGTDELASSRLCEELVRARLLRRVGGHYEFGNDLAQECVLASLPPALAAALHRRAADLLSHRPEAMAEHAWLAGDTDRAVHGWLLAGREAMARSAVDDAVALFDRGVEAAADPALRARLLLARAVAHEARTSFDRGLLDIDAALVLARAVGDRRTEMAALRARCGDIPVGLRLPMAGIAEHLEAGLALASHLGDRRAEADFSTRLIVLECSRLRLAGALTRAEAGLARTRSSASQDAVIESLDALKTVLGYLGEVERQQEVCAELELSLRPNGSLWLLQWAVFDSAFVPAAAADWDAARARVADALELNRRSGYAAYAGYFQALQGWFDRLAGDMDGALAAGRRAVERTSPVDHPWWYATAAGLLAATLVEAGDEDAAAAVARRGLAATGPDTPEAWRLRCLAPLAATSRHDDAYREACRLLDGVSAPRGGAWVVGADCYLLVAVAAARRGEGMRAERYLRRLEVALRGRWAPVRDRVAAVRGQMSSATS